MSGVKLQSLIRKFKNLTKEKTDKNKIITNYQLNLSIDNMVLDTHLFQSDKSATYQLDLLSTVLSINSEIAIINEYIDNNLDTGYLNNVYNTELCNETWLINLYMIDNIHTNFITNDNVNIKSLHIGKLTNLSAFNHYIYNGSLPELVNPEWQWLNTYYGTYDDTLVKKYKNQLLQLLESDIQSFNNINYIINEVSNKFAKINLLTIDSDIHDTHTHLTYASFVVKLMEPSGMLFIKIPNITEWDTEFINILLLYSLLFTEVYIFKFNLLTKSTYLLCKNKKKISNETIYKKLIYIIANKDITKFNLFSRDIFELPVIINWLNNLLVENNNYVAFDKILNTIDSVLKVNTKTFA